MLKHLNSTKLTLECAEEVRKQVALAVEQGDKEQVSRLMPVLLTLERSLMVEVGRLIDEIDSERKAA